MSKSYDRESVDELIARGERDDDLWAILSACWERMPIVEKMEWVRQNRFTIIGATVERNER